MRADRFDPLEAEEPVLGVRASELHPENLAASVRHQTGYLLLSTQTMTRSSGRLADVTAGGCRGRRRRFGRRFAGDCRWQLHDRMPCALVFLFGNHDLGGDAGGGVNDQRTLEIGGQRVGDFVDDDEDVGFGEIRDAEVGAGFLTQRHGVIGDEKQGIGDDEGEVGGFGGLQPVEGGVGLGLDEDVVVVLGESGECRSGERDDAAVIHFHGYRTCWLELALLSPWRPPFLAWLLSLSIPNDPVLGEP